MAGEAQPGDVVTALRVERGGFHRAHVTLNDDEDILLPSRVARALGLAEGLRIDRADLLRLAERQSVTEGMDLALAHLAARARSEVEVRRRLLRAAYPEPAVEEIVARLQAVGYLDDREFAESFVEGRMRAHPMGRRALEWELRRKGLDDGTVEETASVVSDDDERTAAVELARGRARRFAAGDPSARRRLAAFLQRRGFPWDVVSHALDTVLGDEES